MAHDPTPRALKTLRQKAEKLLALGGLPVLGKVGGDGAAGRRPWAGGLGCEHMGPALDKGQREQHDVPDESV
jgi:hypothetical protein